MINIVYKLERIDGFKWVYNCSVRFKGYFFLNEKLYDKNNILDLFVNNNKKKIFHKILENGNGSFALIIENQNEVLFATDKVRSIPLFYNHNKNEFIISDYIEDDLNSVDKNSSEYYEFLMTGYTLNETTLLKAYKQVQAAEYITVNKKEGTYRKNIYYKHLHGNYLNIKKDEHYKNLRDITTSFINRLILSAKDRTIVVPLSGGYDSRYIVSALKEAEHENVICYTYGREDSFEVGIAKKVTEQLGYKSIIIEYTYEKWVSLYNDKSFRDYLMYGFNFCSSPHIQDFIAVKELTEGELIPKDSIIVPGFCGDLLGGSYIPIEFFEGKERSLLKRNISTYIYKCQFKNAKIKLSKSVKKEVDNKINLFMNILSLKNNLDDFVSKNESWFTSHKVAKFVVNALRLYEYFGYEWRMPLWDDGLIKYWYRIQNEQRINNQLFNDFLFDNLFKKQNIDFRKQTPVSHKGFLKIVRKLIPTKLSNGFKWVYHYVIYRNNKDVNNADILSNLQLASLVTKPKMKFNNPNGVMAYWLLSKKSN